MIFFCFLEALQKIVFPKFFHFEMPAQKHLSLKVELIHLQIARSEKNKTCEITNSLFWRKKDEHISIQSNPKAKVGILMKMHLRKESGCSIGLKGRPVVAQ